MNPLLDMSAPVADALSRGQPVVALESTIISHGMPWPQNLETALAVQDMVRANGAVPATVAIMDGRLKAGLDDGDIERLARLGRNAAKASRRDVPILIVQGGTGATTVAATMLISAAAGIRVFATGGIGGVHRGAETSFDISADLLELARTRVAVVCAGAKSILDLRLTLEYLETHGVPVIGYQTNQLPAFFCRDSGLGVDARFDHAADIARLLRAQWQLPSSGGVMIANPVPAEHALPREAVETAIRQALADASAAGHAGKALTPFLLARVIELTGGESLAGNIQLVLNNARLAAQVASAYAAEASAT